MEEQNNKGQLMTEEEFQEFIKKNYYNPDGSQKLCLQYYGSVEKFKSTRRAIRRGHMTSSGIVCPKRPFGNTQSATNILKKKIYEQLKSKAK